MELDADGKIIPVTVTKTNTMFFSAREVMERIPNLYERISYEQLLKMQKDIQTAQWEHTVEGEQKKEQTESQGRVSKEEKPDLSRAEQILQDRKRMVWHGKFQNKRNTRTSGIPSRSRCISGKNPI